MFTFPCRKYRITVKKQKSTASETWRGTFSRHIAYAHFPKQINTLYDTLREG